MPLPRRQDACFPDHVNAETTDYACGEITVQAVPGGLMQPSSHLPLHCVLGTTVLTWFLTARASHFFGGQSHHSMLENIAYVRDYACGEITVQSVLGGLMQPRTISSFVLCAYTYTHVHNLNVHLHMYLHLYINMGVCVGVTKYLATSRRTISCLSRISLWMALLRSLWPGS